jgi:homoserine kinase
MLIPGFDEVKMMCKEAGAMGGGIAGSGPSVFMMSKTRTTAEEVEKIMKGIYGKIGIDHKTYVTTINTTGIKIIESE